MLFDKKVLILSLLVASCWLLAEMFHTMREPNNIHTQLIILTSFCKPECIYSISFSLTRA